MLPPRLLTAYVARRCSLCCATGANFSGVYAFQSLFAEVEQPLAESHSMAGRVTEATRGEYLRMLSCLECNCTDCVVHTEAGHALPENHGQTRDWRARERERRCFCFRCRHAGTLNSKGCQHSIVETFFISSWRFISCLIY